MSKIIKLPQDLINKIAAGEVVERPANVVKELVENSIDANSTQITVELKNAGKSLIKVIDNGDGMSREDALLSIERHATSKITTIEDIYKVKSYGFRGEALASISSVSKFELITSDGKECTRIQVENDIKRVTECSASKGTTIIVKDLFFNVPVRKKYLKSNNVELKHIIDIMIKYAIVHPEIYFKLISDKKVILNAPPVKSLKEKLVLLFGLEYIKNCLEVDYYEDEMKINGFIGNKNLARKSKTDLYIFVNKRPIKSDIIEKALIEGYSNYLSKNEYPFVVLMIEIPPDWVDVNVHPKKETINFFEPEKVFASVFTAIKLKISKKETQKFYTFTKPTEQSSLNFPETKEPRKDEIENALKRDETLQKLIQELRKVNETKESKENEQKKLFARKSDVMWPEFLELNYLGQFALTYLIFESNHELWIFDQHLIEERYYYEKLKKKNNQQRLLKPLILKYNKKDHYALKESKSLLQELGFDIEELRDSFVIRAVPDVLNKFDNEERNKLVKEIIDEFIELKKTTAIEKIKDETIATIACKSSVKSGVRLDPYQIKRMILNLSKCEQPYTCPHGRPVIIKISKKELDKMFKRIS